MEATSPWEPLFSGTDEVTSELLALTVDIEPAKIDAFTSQ